jgi:hypothetical protein
LGRVAAARAALCLSPLWISQVACDSVATQARAEAPSVAPPEDKPVVMPTPGSVSFAEPGGDAPDKEAAALSRLADPNNVDISVRWGWRGDKGDTVMMRFLDAKQWRRGVIFGTPTRMTYRYGEPAYAVELLVYEPSEGPSDPRTCLEQFLRFADDVAVAYAIDYKVSPIDDQSQTVDGVKKPIAVALLQGHSSFPLFTNDYTGAVVAYQSFPGTCLVQGFAAVATRHPDIAKRARDTWIVQAAPQLHWNPNKVTDKPPAFDNE